MHGDSKDKSCYNYQICQKRENKENKSIISQFKYSAFNLPFNEYTGLFLSLITTGHL